MKVLDFVFFDPPPKNKYICTAAIKILVLFKPVLFIWFEAGTKVGPDKLGPPVRVGSTRTNSDQIKK